MSITSFGFSFQLVYSIQCSWPLSFFLHPLQFEWLWSLNELSKEPIAGELCPSFSPASKNFTLMVIMKLRKYLALASWNLLCNQICRYVGDQGPWGSSHKHILQRRDINFPILGPRAKILFPPLDKAHHICQRFPKASRGRLIPAYADSLVSRVPQVENRAHCEMTTYRG